MMKKIILLFFLASLTFLGNAQKDKYKIVVSASMLADMAENIIAGEDEIIQCIVPIGGDPHLHEPTPADARLVADADMVFINGLTFEGWIEKLIKSSGTKARVVVVTDGITPIGSDDYENSTDPHAWMDVENVLTYVKNMKDALSEERPENKEMYEFNYGVYTQALKDTDQYIKNQVTKIPLEKRVLITSHDAFKYFGRKYGLELESVIGISTESEAQTADVIRLTKVIKERKIPCVFIESTINPKLLKELAKSTDTRIGGELYADSLGPKDSEAGTYIDMVKYNINTIVKGLTQKVDKKTSAVATKTEESSSNNVVWIILGVLLLLSFAFVAKKLNN